MILLLDGMVLFFVGAAGDTSVAFRTLTQLVLGARQKADKETDGNHVNDTEVIRYINEAMHDLWDLLIQANPPMLSKAVDGTLTQITTENQVDFPGAELFSFQLPSDFYRMANISYFDGSVVRDIVPMHGEGRPYEARLLSRTTGYPIFSLRWDVTNGDWFLYVYPTEVTASQVYLEYIPLPPTLVAGVTENLYLPGEWFEYLEISAALRMTRKEESDTSELWERRAEMREQIMLAFRKIDITRSAKIRDVTSSSLRGGRVAR